MFHDWCWFVSFYYCISLSFFVCVRDGGMDGPHFLLGNGDERACYYCFVLFCLLCICARRYLGENYWPSFFRHESGPILHMRLRDHPYLEG